jgi:hypothetical protein
MRSRIRRAAGAAALAVALLVLFPGSRAGATVTGPCSARIAGASIDAGHDSAGTAIHVDAHASVPYSGERTDGGPAGEVVVTTEVLGLHLATVRDQADGSRFAGSVDVGRFTGIGVGLVRVGATASGGACTATALLCIEGRSPLATAAGGAAAGVAVAGILLAAISLVRRGGASRAGLAARMGTGGLLVGAATPVLLQQTCVLPMTAAAAGGFAGGGLAAFAVIGALAASRGRTPRRVRRRQGTLESAAAPGSGPSAPGAGAGSGPSAPGAGGAGPTAPGATGAGPTAPGAQPGAGPTAPAPTGLPPTGAEPVGAETGLLAAAAGAGAAWGVVAAGGAGTEDDRVSVYRLSPGAEPCGACVDRAAHRTYRDFDVADGDRPHPGCSCLVIVDHVDASTFADRFPPGVAVHDDRAP